MLFYETDLSRIFFLKNDILCKTYMIRIEISFQGEQICSFVFSKFSMKIWRNKF